MPKISNKNGTLFYSKKGHGERILVAFHGYGQDHAVFDSFFDAFSETYTLYSFDIFFHGKSNLNKDEQLLTKVQWASYISKMIKTENITSFDVIGYSMGGKFALATAESFPKQCRQLLLLAPDGIEMNFWYKIITKYAIMQRLFHYTVQNPSLYSILSKIASIINLAPKKLIEFANSMMMTETKREHVYKTWMLFRGLFTSPQLLKKLIEEHSMQVDIFVGENDKIVKPNSIYKMFKSVNEVKIHTINSGHGKLIEETIRYIKTNNHIIK